MSNPKPFLFLLFTFMSFCASGVAQRNSYTTAKVPDNSIRIDADADESAWDQAEWSGNYIQTMPFDSIAPSQNTAFKTVYDNDAIYFLIRAYDAAPDSIERQMCRRDGWEGDMLLLREMESMKMIHGILYVKTLIDDKGWLAEAKIPYTQLRFGNKSAQVWGLQLTRRLYRHQEWSSWQYISPNASGFTSNFGDLQGLHNISPKSQVEIMPFILGGFENYEKEEGNPFHTGKLG